MSNPPLPVPDVTEDMIRYGRENPGKRLYVMDPEFTDPDNVPGWGVRGVFPIGPDGTILTGQFTQNPRYRPGPRVLGLPRPQNELERALELAATAYGPESALIATLARSHLLVVTDPAAPDQVAVFDVEGTRALLAYTSAARVPNSGIDVTSVPVAALRPILHDVVVRLNPGAVPSTTLPGTDLVAALDEKRRGRATPTS